MPDISALVGTEVRRLLLDHQVTLFFGQGRPGAEPTTAQLIVEAPFQLARAGRSDEVNPKRKETLPQVCGLLFTAVIAAVIDEQTLELSFDDGSKITVDPHPDYTAWRLIGQGVPNVRAELIAGDQSVTAKTPPWVDPRHS